VNGSTAATNAVTSFNGLTGAVQGIQSFNGATGAATGASLGANTFIGLNTFNGGITTSFLYASTGSTFGARVDVAGILDVVGGVTLESTSDHAGAARFASTVVSTGSVTANGGLTASTLDVSGAARTTGDVTVGATLTVNGNFQVYGTLTTVNRTDLNIDDKTITMGRTLASDTLADGGGLSLSGTAARTWTWSNSRSAWESNQGVNVASTYGYAVNGTSVLTSNTLGSGVTGSSLTKVGTLTTGVWQATAIGATYGGTGIISYTIGDVLYANGTSSLAKLTTTTAGYLLAANGSGAAPEYKQVLIKDAAANSIATVTSGSGTLTATIQNATSSAKGVASFDNTNFTVSTGAVTITGVDGGTY
jgi:cytoskeletal protein CcmA (bactofilin family)